MYTHFLYFWYIDVLVNEDSVNGIVIVFWHLRLYFQNDKTRQEIIDLSNGKNLEELKKRLCNQLSFGTAGRFVVDVMNSMCLEWLIKGYA